MNVVKYLPRFQKAYRDLELLAEHECWTSDQIAQHQLARINQLWTQARGTVPFYRDLADRCNLPDQFESLDAFRSRMPVLDKQTVRESPIDFLSSSPERGFWTRTGGSTGTPMRCYWSQRAHREMLRTKYRFYGSWGADFFDRTVFLWGHGASFAPGLAGRVAQCRQPLEDRLRNRLRLSAYRLDSQTLQKYLRHIQVFRPAILYGYSSALHLLAAEAEASGLRCEGLKLVTMTGEPALPEFVSTIERVFQVPAAVEYGSIECGLMAAEWPDRTLRVREDVVMLETRPRADGRFDVLVTVLNNPSFPLFRYAIGDVVEAELKRESTGFAILGSVSGQVNDYVVTPSGSRIHSSRLDALFKYETQAVRRFRIHQQQSGAVQAWVELQSGSGATDLMRIASRLRALVEGFPVTVNAVTELPATSAGKHRIVVSDRAPDIPMPCPEIQLGARPICAFETTHEGQCETASIRPLSKAARLRQLLLSPDLVFLMEAYNGLSARIAEEAGFPAVWASGPSITASLGLRDANETTWNRVLDVLEFMSDATSVPILVDGNMGRGELHHARHFVRKLEQRRLGGICIEDRLFAGPNEFLCDELQPLADTAETCRRIHAAKDTQLCNDFVIVARCDAIAAGWGATEAIRRSDAYHRAGADAILIHVARSDVADLLKFQEEWSNRTPVALLLSKHDPTPIEKFRHHGISAVIWGDQLLHACVAAMRRAARSVCNGESSPLIDSLVDRGYPPEFAALSPAVVPMEFVP